jgi:DNA invertase Pin-like site-specific DNA recombinase
MIVGYARTSTVDQVAGFEAQVKELAAAGCEKVFQEQVSSVTVRLQLQSALEFIREGDVFVVTKLDRLARSITDLMPILQALGRKGVAVRILNLDMDTQTPRRPTLPVNSAWGGHRVSNPGGCQRVNGCVTDKRLGHHFVSKEEI